MFFIIYNAEPRGIKSPARGLLGLLPSDSTLMTLRREELLPMTLDLYAQVPVLLTNPTVHGFSKMRYFVHYTSDLNNDTIIETARTASQYKSQTPISCK